VNIKNLRYATLGELCQVIREEGTAIEKCVAHSELERRAFEYGIRFTDLISSAA
jgi:hypothetical protein